MSVQSGDNRGSYLSYLGDVPMVDQYSFSFRVLPTKMFSGPVDQLAPLRTYLKDIVSDDIKRVLVLLNEEVKIGTGDSEGRHTEETL
jgi:hypothetical protein